MATDEIIVRVSPEASRQEQQKLEALASLQLPGKLQPQRGLDEVIERMSRQAQEKGLTPEILEALLRGDD
jgi:hypothetical protein